MITKNQIKLIKSLRSKKNRIQSGFFVAEGEKIVDELIESDLNSINIFSTSEKYKNLKNHISINSTQLKQISNQKSPNNVVGIFKIPKDQEIDFNANIVALEDINDPGNLGTIIRLCDWFGIKNIICSMGVRMYRVVSFLHLFLSPRGRLSIYISLELTCINTQGLITRCDVGVGAGVGVGVGVIGHRPREVY